MQRTRVLSAFVFLFVILMSGCLWAATQNAVVYGSVYDAKGSQVAGATVVIENRGIGFSRTTVTGSDGSYSFAEVPPADNYQLKAVIGGRVADIRTGITINVGDERVILPPLQEQVAVAAGTTTESKKVERRAPSRAVVAETVSTAVSGVITGDQLRSLPLYNRNFLALGLLTPNTHEPDAGSELRGASFSVAGARPNQNNFLLDGTDNVASSSNQAVPFQVNDSIQEFRVISSTAPAEYGRNVGGVVNVVTRRAGNGFHGSAFGYFGSDSLNADNPLSTYLGGTTFDRAAAYAGPVNAAPLLSPAAPTNYNEYVATAEANGYCTDSLGLATGTAACPSNGGALGANHRFDPASVLAGRNLFKQPFDSKQFGANAGGALIADKLFLFGSYEGTRIDNPNPIFERVPSSFDRTYNPLGDPASPRAIATGGLFGFANNHPDYVLGQNILSLYPAANVVAVPDALEFYQGFAPNYTNVDNGLVRLDWTATQSTNVSVRYVIQSLNQLHDSSLPEQAQYAGNGAFRDALNHSANISIAHNFSNNVVNELRLNYSQFRVTETPQDAGLDATQFGLPSPQLMTFFLSGLDTQYSGQTPVALGAMGGWADAFWSGFNPMIPTLDGLFPLARIGAPVNAPGSRRDVTWGLADTVSIPIGRHSFRAGAEFRLLRNHFLDAGLSRGFVVASNLGEFTSDSETCTTCFESFGQFAGTGPSFDYALRQPDPYRSDFKSWAMAWFLQDTVRLTRRVTVNLGLRYEYFSVPSEANNGLWNYDPLANGLVQAGSTSVIDPFGQPCAPQTFNFANYTAIRSPVPNFDWNCFGQGSGRTMISDTNNFAPRAGVAWDVFGTGKTVVRAGIGLYYDQLPVSYLAHLAYNRPSPFNADDPQAMYGQNFFAGGCFQCSNGSSMLNPANIVGSGFQDFVSASSPQAIYARDLQHSDSPMSREISASVQQSLTDHLVLELGYIGASSRHLPVIYNSGFENEWFCVNTPTCDVISNYPIFTMTGRGGSSYHSLMGRVRAADWHGLRVNATYNWSKGIDNASNPVYPLVTNSFFNQALSYQLRGNGNPSAACLAFGPGFLPIPGNCSLTSQVTVPSVQSALTTTGAGQVYTTPYLLPQDPVGAGFLLDDRGRSDFDSTHRLVLDYTFDVPSLHKGSKLWDGWQLSGIFSAQSGQPFTIFSGTVMGEIDQRVDVTGPVALSGDPNAMISTANLSLPGASCMVASPNANSFAVPAAGDFLFDGVPGTACVGNSHRNAFTGPSFINMNFAIQKSIPIFGEGKVLTLRSEFYNLFNRANYYNPISTLSLDGTSINPDFGKVKSAHDPRQIQFAARFRW